MKFISFISIILSGGMILWIHDHIPEEPPQFFNSILDPQVVDPTVIDAHIDVPCQPSPKCVLQEDFTW